MRKLTLQEWAIEKGIHYKTARIRFDKGLIDRAVKDEFNKIFVFMHDTQEEEDLELYNKMLNDTSNKK